MQDAVAAEAVTAADLITSSTVARILNRAESTVRLWRQNGKLQPIAITETGTAIYRRSDVERINREINPCG